MLSILPKSDNTLKLYNSHPGIHYTGDAGIDLIIPCDLLIPANAKGFPIDHNISCMLVELGCHVKPQISYYLYPRSSISKTPLRMCNSLGVIDAQYRGMIIGMVDNISNEDYLVKSGTRLFQICQPSLEPLQLEIVTSLPSSERGEKGFGSTGL